MNAARVYGAQLSRLHIFSDTRTRVKIRMGLVSIYQARSVSAHKTLKKGQGVEKYKKKSDSAKKKKTRNSYIQYDLKDADQFSLCDAMRYIQAAEVGQSPTSVKYELHVKLKSLKNGPVLRSRLQLPHRVTTDLRICVICPPDSKHAEVARAAGAVLVGEEDVFESIKDGQIEFDRCICQTDSLAKMNKAGLGRILGPRQLMPSAKMGTVVKNVSTAVAELVNGAEYRERLGVVRMAIGQLGFTPEQLQRNIKAFIDAIRKDTTQIRDKINKELAEVVLSSTHGPGLTLNGEFLGVNSSISSKDLSRF